MTPRNKRCSMQEALLAQTAGWIQLKSIAVQQCTCATGCRLLERNHEGVQVQVYTTRVCRAESVNVYYKVTTTKQKPWASEEPHMRLVDCGANACWSGLLNPLLCCLPLQTQQD